MGQAESVIRHDIVKDLEAVIQSAEDIVQNAKGVPSSFSMLRFASLKRRFQGLFEELLECKGREYEKENEQFLTRFTRLEYMWGKKCQPDVYGS